MITSLLILTGVVFLLVGVYNSLTFSVAFGSLKLLIANFFQPSNDVSTSTGVLTGPGFGSVLLFFSPAFIFLGLSIYYSKQFAQLAYRIALVSAIYLIGIQCYFFIISYTGIFYYINPYTPSFFLILSTVLLLIAALIHRKSILLIVSLIYFYISVEIIAMSYFVPFFVLFSLVFILSIAVYWIALKLERPNVNVVNYLFALIFLAFFVLRKFYINNKIEYLTEYIIFSICFYLLFLAIQILSANSKNKPLNKWLHLVLNWSNLVCFIISTSFILDKYVGNIYLYLFAVSLLIINVVVIFILRKFSLKTYISTYYLNVILLISLQLPLWVHQNVLVLFGAVLSLLLIIYSNYFKSKIALWISISSLTYSLCAYLFLWIFYYVPVIVDTNQLLLDPLLLRNGTILVVLMLIILWATKRHLDSATLPIKSKWLHAKSYGQLVLFLLLIAEFLTLGWIVFLIVYLLTGTGIYSYTGLFISGSIFFILLIHSFAGKSSVFKKPFLYISLFHVLLYPLFLGWTVTKENIISGKSLNYTGIFVHYTAIILLIYLSIMIIRRIYLRNKKKPFIQNSVQFLAAIYLAFLLYTEYNNLILIIEYFQNLGNSNYELGVKSLANNQFLPFSIILLILSIGIFTYSMFTNKAFVKKVAIAMFVISILKVLVYDYLSIASNNLSVMFYVVGISLISVALIYPLILKSRNKDLK